MKRVKFGDIVRDVKVQVDRSNNPYLHYVAGDHMDSMDLTIRRKGSFATDDVGPAFIRIFKPGQVLYGSRRTYLKKIAVADFEGICSNTTFVLETKDSNVFLQELLPFIMLSESFTKWSISHSKGSTNPYVLFSDLANYEFTLPSLSEQKVLADKLWAAYRVKESYKKLLAATDDMLKAKFQDMFGDCDSSIEGLSFEEVFTIKDNLRCPLNDTTRKDMHEGDELYPYYGANGLVDHINQYKIDMTAICLAEDCGKYGPGEETAYIIHGKSWVNNHAHILVPKDNCDIVYAKMLFTIMDLNKYVDNDNRKKLTQANMKKIKILCPPLPLQQQFVEIATQAEATKESLRKSIENIDQVIKSLINQ